jgi:hypothetical protein
LTEQSVTTGANMMVFGPLAPTTTQISLTHVLRALMARWSPWFSSLCCRKPEPSTRCRGWAPEQAMLYFSSDAIAVRNSAWS